MLDPVLGEVAARDELTVGIDLIEVAVGPHDARIVSERLTQDAEVLGVPEVVLVQEGDELAGRDSDSSVPGRGLAGVGLVHDPDRERCGEPVEKVEVLVVGTVDDDHQLFWWLGLADDALDRAAQVPPTAIDRDDHAHTRQRRGGRRSIERVILFEVEARQVDPLPEAGVRLAPQPESGSRLGLMVGFAGAAVDFR